jgi:S-adenosyl-L-methionine hydrolase (adenosine-forming)
VSRPGAPGSGSSGVITLTTDFGLEAPFVGVMKGVILRLAPAVRIVDLTHQIRPYWPAEAGFWLARSFGYFPAGTVHVAVVDPGVGTARGLLAASCAGHHFLAPDNGLLAPLLAQQRQALVVRIDVPRAGLSEVSSTFHGRDILAPLAARLAAGLCSVADLGAGVTAWVPAPVADPVVAAGEVSGVVISIDRYGNLISNIDAPLLAALASPVVHAGGRSLPLVRTYGDVPAGSHLALINSFGVLEVAQSQGSAAASLGLGLGAAVTVSLTL